MVWLDGLILCLPRTTVSQSGHGIGYMSLENTSAVYCLNVSGRRMIDKLTFEPSRKSLYWVNKMDAENSTIERYDIQTGQHSTVAAYAADVTGIILMVQNDYRHQCASVSLSYIYLSYTSNSR